jgi:hypothetical protein
VQELEAATRRSVINAAAKKLQGAKAELRRLELETAKQSKRSSRGSR